MQMLGALREVGGRRLQAVVLVSCVSIDPLSFAGPSVAKHSSEIKF